MRLPDAEVSLMDTAEAQEEFRTVVARLASSPALWVSAADVTITSIVAGSVLVTATVQLPTHQQVEALTQPGSDPGLSPRQRQDWVMTCLQGGRAFSLAVCGVGNALLLSAGAAGS